MDDIALARDIAARAGETLMALRRAGALSGKELGQAGDRAANALILEALRAQRPEDAILSEEENDNPARLKARRVWIIDPLDGTREFGEGRADWAVHIGLSVDGAPSLGVVALPGLSQILSSGDPPRAPARQGAPRAPARQGAPRMVVSRTRPPKEALEVARALGASLIEMGSAGAKAMAIVRGEAEIYLHAGGQYEWDNCAPAAVALAAGLHASRADGSPLRYNQPDTYLPDLLICRPELAESVLAAYRRVAAIS